jgi:hypothetical protein
MTDAMASSIPIALLIFFVAGRARADDQVPLTLRYTAPPACPSADHFVAEVAARTSLYRAALPNESATTLTVVIKEVEGGNRGILELEAADGTISARHVSAADCEQVVSALALMTALAVDPNASTAPARDTPQPPVKAAKSVVRAEPAAPPQGRWRLQIGAALEAVGGVAPGPLFLVRPSLEIGSESASRWSTAWRLSAGVGRRVVRGPVGGGEFTLFSGRIEGCPARFGATRAVQIEPCFAVDAGRLEAVGIGVTPAERIDRPWVAPGAVGRLEWEIAKVLLVEVAGEIFFPLVRGRFFVGSDATLYRTPLVAGGATAGLSVRFP